MKKQNIAGFTMIEILVVILIIVIILGLSLTVFEATKKSARDQQRLRDLNTIKQALELYRSDNHSYPSSLIFGGSLTYNNKTYLGKVPNDMVSGRTYQYQNLTGSTFVLCAKKEGSNPVSFPSECTGFICIEAIDTFCDMGISSD